MKTFVFRQQSSPIGTGNCAEKLFQREVTQVYLLFTCLFFFAGKGWSNHRRTTPIIRVHRTPLLRRQVSSHLMPNPSTHILKRRTHRQRLLRCRQRTHNNSTRLLHNDVGREYSRRNRRSEMNANLVAHTLLCS